MKCIQKSNNMWTQCYAQSYKPAETFMPRAGRKKSQGVNINIVNLICHVSELLNLGCNKNLLHISLLGVCNKILENPYTLTHM